MPDLPELDLQIRNGTIVDGALTPRYQGDVWIQGGRIAQLGGEAPGEARRGLFSFSPFNRCRGASRSDHLGCRSSRRRQWRPWGCYRCGASRAGG